MSTRSTCEGGHIVLWYPSGFVSINVLKELCAQLPHPTFRIMEMQLCPLPGFRGMLHCHCDNPSSLQCRAMRRILLHVIRGNCTFRTPDRIPYTHCCTAFTISKTNDVVFLSSSNDVKIGDFLDHIEVPYTMYNAMRRRKVYEIGRKLSVPELNEIAYLLHRHINLEHSGRLGYHLGDLDTLRTLTIDDAFQNVCMLRFLSLRTCYQERFIKTFLDQPRRTHDVTPLLLPPPIDLGNDTWSCRYAFDDCSCQRRCECVNYIAVTVTKETAMKYLDGRLERPFALRDYIKLYEFAFK
ncbi:E4 protein [Duck adenovirus 1]|uniref:E4 protein n=1 Tax=Duck adenovirus 1 TaxID=130329 RepID=A0A0D3MWU3_DADV1|nr:E4 protein [Duck adenovirus 1]AJA72369.1 E4 protein [Duck adenovirus 1]